jgi:hypothetical protein
MTPREENEVLAQWAGVECRCTKHARYTQCPRHSNNGIPPDYDRDEVAISLVPLLVNKTGLPYEVIVFATGGCQCQPATLFREVSTLYPTIAAAIKAAVLQLIEKEVSPSHWLPLPDPPSRLPHNNC